MKPIVFLSDWNPELDRAVISVAEPWPERSSCSDMFLLCDSEMVSVDWPTSTITFTVANGRAIYKFAPATEGIHPLELICSEFTAPQPKGEAA